MVAKSDFTEDEWKMLERGFTGTGMYVSMSDQAFSDMFKETKAIAKYLVALQQNDSALVRELAKNHKSPFGMTAKPGEVETQTLDALRGSIALLKERAPEEVDHYSAAALAIAQAVAEAAKGVSGDEATALQKIREAVGA